MKNTAYVFCFFRRNKKNPIYLDENCLNWTKHMHVPSIWITDASTGAG